MEPRYSVIITVSVQQYDTSFRAEKTESIPGSAEQLEYQIAWGAIARTLIIDALESVKAKLAKESEDAADDAG